ncbi:MAG: helix-turn-helix domain-containing protein [Actinobacteria bacterium]|nr:helix-turn-helix domain-containing protein [Actinomycetota bacterium]
MPSRFGRQPARSALIDAGLSLSSTAERLGLPRSHLRSAVLGYSPPSPGLREGLSRLLGRPVSELFSPEALQAAYDPNRGPGASERRTEWWASSSPSTEFWDAMVAAAAADPLDVISDDAVIAQMVALLTARGRPRQASPVTEVKVPASALDHAS